MTGTGIGAGPAAQTQSGINFNHFRPDEDEDVQWIAAWSLGKIGDPIVDFFTETFDRPVNTLIKALDDEDEDVQLAAAFALGSLR